MFNNLRAISMLENPHQLVSILMIIGNQTFVCHKVTEMFLWQGLKNAHLKTLKNVFNLPLLTQMALAESSLCLDLWVLCKASCLFT